MPADAPDLPTTTQTKHVRLALDIAEMISAITFHDEQITAAELCDPLLRPTIEERFESLPEYIRQRALRRIGTADGSASTAD